jgi:hypothetical protein
VMAHQVVRELVDNSIQEKLMAKASNRTELSLTELVAYVES